MEQAKKKSGIYNRGIITAVVLAILTIIESFGYFRSLGVPVFEPSTVVLMLIAILKAGIILNYFMHIYRLWRSEESH